MTDLRERFKVLDALEVPDLREEIFAPTLRRAPAPPSRHRLVAGALAGLVALLAAAAVGWALLRLRQIPEPVTEPRPAVTPAPKIDDVFDIEPVPLGTERIGVEGQLVARAVEGDQHWFLSVTRRRDVLCVYLNTGGGCVGWPTAQGVPRDPIGVLGSFEEGPKGPEMSFVYGPAEKRVAEVAVRFTDGTTLRATLIDGPPGFEANFYIVGVRGTARPITIQAVDRHGAVVGMVVLGRSWSPGQDV